MKTTQKLAAVLLAVATIGGARTADAQVQFFTTGQFTGPALCTGMTSCAFGGYNLIFTAAALTPAAPNQGFTFNLGYFNFTGAGTTSAPPGLGFELTVHQVNPASPDGSTVGNISGIVQSTGSGLVWQPTQLIGPLAGDVKYNLIFDATTPAGINIGLNSGPLDNTAIKAKITASPEPASMTLLATGLVGIFGAARSRRKNKLAA